MSMTSDSLPRSEDDDEVRCAEEDLLRCLGTEGRETTTCVYVCMYVCMYEMCLYEIVHGAEEAR